MSQHGERGDDVRELLLAVAAAYKAEANLSDDDDNDDGAQAVRGIIFVLLVH